jgi:hypothetical protein
MILKLEGSGRGRRINEIAEVYEPEVWDLPSSALSGLGDHNLGEKRDECTMVSVF